MHISFVPTILLSVLLNSAAQLLLRHGMPKVQLNTDSGLIQLMSSCAKAALSPWVFSGLLCFAASLVIWMYVLSKVPVSFAYPFNSVGYVMVVTLAFVFFGEPLGPMRGVGIALICAGVFLVARGA